jgi:hypothetical protein
MWKDPIVEEIHKIREEIAREYDYNLNRIMDHLRKKEMKHPDRIIYKKEMIASRTSNR